MPMARAHTCHHVKRPHARDSIVTTPRPMQDPIPTLLYFTGPASLSSHSQGHSPFQAFQRFGAHKPYTGGLAWRMLRELPSFSPCSRGCLLTPTGGSLLRGTVALRVISFTESCFGSTSARQSRDRLNQRAERATRWSPLLLEASNLCSDLTTRLSSPCRCFPWRHTTPRPTAHCCRQVA